VESTISILLTSQAAKLERKSLIVNPILFHVPMPRISWAVAFLDEVCMMEAHNFPCDSGFFGARSMTAIES
jgi:hypothetical protein